MPKMENDSDTQNILASDDNEAINDTEEHDENEIPLQNMSERPSEESTCSVADDNVIYVRTCNGPPAEENGTNQLSSSSSCCRICQNGDSSEQLLEESPCKCRGYLGKAHKKCLLEWVRYKGTNKCEICGETFANISPPPELGINQLEYTTMPDVEPPTTNSQFEALEALRWQLDRLRPISRGRRSAMAGVIVFLALVTFVSAILTVGADRDFRRVNQDPWSSRGEQEKTHIIFSVCISFLFFSGTLTIGLALLWLILEGYYAIHRRRILQRTAERMIAESARERRLGLNARQRTATNSARVNNQGERTQDGSETATETLTDNSREEIGTERTDEGMPTESTRAGVSNESAQISDE